MSSAGFQLKASSMTFTSLILFTPNLDLVEEQLKALAAKTPNFFDATPVLLDLTTVETHNLPLDMPKLLALVRQYRLSPIGIKSYSNAHKEFAKAQHLAIIAQAETAAVAAEKTAEIKSEVKPAVTTGLKTKIIDQPVRSGKQIYAKGADLIVTSSVSHGAEIIADGNIHIYGTLNGRALAGAQGDTNARIFCRNVDAELIAIAGNYLVNEQIPHTHKTSNQFLEIFLADQTLQFKAL